MPLSNESLLVFLNIHIHIYIYMKSEAIHETGLSGYVVASFFPLIIFIYIHIYIYLLIYIRQIQISICVII